MGALGSFFGAAITWLAATVLRVPKFDGRGARAEGHPPRERTRREPEGR